MGERPAVINSDLNGFAIFKVGNTNDTGERQGTMSSRDLVLIEYFAIGGFFAVEFRSVPGRNTRFAIFVINSRIIPLTGNFVGIANLVISDLSGLSGRPQSLHAVNCELGFGTAREQYAKCCDRYGQAAFASQLCQGTFKWFGHQCVPACRCSVHMRSDQRSILNDLL